MTDKQKLEMIDNILSAAWEYTIGAEAKEGFWEGALCAIGAVLGMEGDT